MKKMILSTLVVSFSMMASFAQAATEVARVNDKVITAEQVNSHLAEQARTGLGTPSTKRAALDDLIKREAAIQEAKKLKLDQDPAVIERMNNMLVAALLEKKVGAEFNKFTLSDAETKNWYEKSPEIRTSHIFVALSPNAAAEAEQMAKARLEQAMAEIKSGKVSFAEAAQKYSEDPSAALGGDLDYRMKDRLDPAYYRAAQRIGKIGDITGPIRTPFGMHLIRLTGKHAWNEVDRNRVKRIIAEDKRVELTNRYLNDLRQKSKVSINEKALN